MFHLAELLDLAFGCRAYILKRLAALASPAGRALLARQCCFAGAQLAARIPRPPLPPTYTDRL